MSIELCITHWMFFSLKTKHIYCLIAEDPCAVNKGGCQDICSFEDGIIQCSCSIGTLQPDGKNCDDI